MEAYNTIKLFIPKELIKEKEEHPEEYGELVVILKNNMWTDVYTDEAGLFYSLTNDEDLIEYVKKHGGKVETI